MPPLFTYTGPGAPPTHDCPVFLPGWGFDGLVAGLADPHRHWLTTSRPASPGETLAGLADAVAKYRLQSLSLVGWSLGARLALDFAEENPEKVSALYLLAHRNSWPQTELDDIRRELATDRITFLKTFYRKCFLGYRRAYQEFQRLFEEDYLAAVTPESLEQGLARLGEQENRQRLAGLLDLGIPLFLLQGGRDVIAPPDEAAAHSGAGAVFLPHAGHPLFLEPGFNPEMHLRKAAIRHKFSRAAATYDEYAATQMEAAQRLVELLPGNLSGDILELGCGTGNLTRLLAERFPESRITALDFSEGMLGVARVKAPQDHISFLCRDAELFLQGSDRRYDLVVSNATLQWFDDLEGAINRVAACLKPGGCFAASVFGPASLGELRSGLAHVNPGREIMLPVDDFPSKDRLENILGGNFTTMAIEEWLNHRLYPDLERLFLHLRRTGTAGPGRSTPLIDRPRFTALAQWFKEEIGEFRLTYQIFLVRAI